MLDLNLIRTDGGTQSRAKLDEAVVAEYAEAYKAGAKFPPITVFYDGKDRWLADGFHRYFGAKAAGKKSILEVVTSGTKREAVLYSLGANGTHGLNRTNADKRNAVEMMLADAEWAAWSNVAVAKACSVSEGFVRSLRINEVTLPVERTYTNKQGTTATMQTARIGKTIKPTAKTARVEPEDAEYTGPSIEELESLRQQARADTDKLFELLESDDPKGELVRENERQRMEIATLKSQRDGYMNQANELIRRVKSLKKMLEKAQAVAA